VRSVGAEGPSAARPLALPSTIRFRAASSGSPNSSGEIEAETTVVILGWT
jgi:hypothetical protein